MTKKAAAFVDQWRRSQVDETNIEQTSRLGLHAATVVCGIVLASPRANLLPAIVLDRSKRFM
jgi:hypothetical protein